MTEVRPLAIGLIRKLNFYIEEENLLKASRTTVATINTTLHLSVPNAITHSCGRETAVCVCLTFHSRDYPKPIQQDTGKRWIQERGRRGRVPIKRYGTGCILMDQNGACLMDQRMECY